MNKKLANDLNYELVSNINNIYWCYTKLRPNEMLVLEVDDKLIIEGEIKSKISDVIISRNDMGLIMNGYLNHYQI